MTQLDSSSWWEIDRMQTVRQIQGATPLLEVCIETYGWQEEKARRVLTGYRQFLELKKRVGDYESNILEPSNAVDEMWVQHFSTRNYSDDCQLLCGGFVHRDGYERLSHVARAKRIESTRPLLKAIYGPAVDEDVWSFGAKLNSLILTTGKAMEEETTIMFRPHAYAGLSEAQFDLALSTSFVVAACLYSADQGKELRDLRFLVDGQEVSPEVSLAELGFADGQVIDVMYRDVSSRQG